MVETEEKLWKRVTRIYVTIEVDHVDRIEVCSRCGKQGHSVEVCKSKKEIKADSNKSGTMTTTTEKPLLCSICKRGRHDEKNYYSVVGRPGEKKPNRGAPTATMTMLTTKSSQQLSTAMATEQLEQGGEKKELKQRMVTGLISNQKSCS